MILKCEDYDLFDSPEEVLTAIFNEVVAAVVPREGKNYIDSLPRKEGASTEDEKRIRSYILNLISTMQVGVSLQLSLRFNGQATAFDDVRQAYEDIGRSSDDHYDAQIRTGADLSVGDRSFNASVLLYKAVSRAYMGCALKHMSKQL